MTAWRSYRGVCPDADVGYFVCVQQASGPLVDEPPVWLQWLQHAPARKVCFRSRDCKRHGSRNTRCRPPNIGLPSTLPAWLSEAAAFNGMASADVQSSLEHPQR